ncbi:Anoctamin-9 [Plecturocebus cupreus]
MIKDQKQMFFGIRANNSIFDLYRTLLLEPEGPTRHTEQAEAMSVPDIMSPPAQEGASKPGPPCPPDLLSPVQAPRGSACLVDQPRTFLVLATKQGMGIVSRELQVLGKSEGRQSGEVARWSEGSCRGVCGPEACPEVSRSHVSQHEGWLGALLAVTLHGHAALPRSSPEPQSLLRQNRIAHRG